MSKLEIHSEHYDIIVEALTDLLNFEQDWLLRSEGEQQKALIKKTCDIEDILDDIKEQYENEKE